MSSDITFRSYLQSVLRTAREHTDPQKGLAVAALGLAGEAGEAADIIKKHVGHDHPLDLEKFHKELGDVLYYVGLLAHSTGKTLEEIAQMNVDKLAARYPDGFTVEKSFHRGQ